MSGGSMVHWRASRAIASSQGPQTDQAGPRLSALRATRLPQRRQRRRRAALRSSSCTAAWRRVGSDCMGSYRITENFARDTS